MNQIDIEDVKESLSDVVDLFVGGPHQEAEVAAAEKALGVTLPESYRAFLLNWGNIALGNIEYYGLTKSSDFDSAGVPNVVWFTQRKRLQVGLPDALVVFQNDNDEVYYCINTELETRDKYPIVVWNNLDRCIANEFEIDFFAFLLGDIEEHLA